MNFTKEFTQNFTIVGEFAIFKQKLATYNRFFFCGGRARWIICNFSAETNLITENLGGEGGS